MAKKCCIICGREIGFLTGKVKCADGWICTPCYTKMGFSTWGISDLNRVREMHLEEVQVTAQARAHGLDLDGENGDGEVEGKGTEFMKSSMFERVSIRKYQDRPVEPEKTEYMLRAAMQAPSAGNQQPWDFYVITNKDVLKRLSTICKYSGPAAEAPIAILVTTRENCRFAPVVDVDSSICTEHLWLACAEVGLGGVWLGVAPFQERMDAVREIIDLPDDVHPFALFAYGYPAEERTQRDRYDEERIHYIK